MASDMSLTNIIDFGNDVVSIKMYATSVATLWGYDYLLTLEDEVEFAWKAKNVPMFLLFMITRYLPAPFLVWTIISSWSPSYTTELCQRTVFLELVYFTFITLIAHVVLTSRIHAITKTNKWIASSLYGVAILQFWVGTYLFLYSSLSPRQLPRLDLDAYRICIFNIPTSGTIFYTSFSLAFDVGALFVVLVRTQGLRTQYRDSNIPNTLDTITRVTKIHFWVIFSTDFLLVLTLVLVKPLLRFIPIVGNMIFVPTMTTRLILSLRKAASTPPSFEMVRIPAGSPAAQRPSCTEVTA